VQLQALHNETLAHREDYLKLRDKIARLGEELNTWQTNTVPIEHILAVEKSGRGIHFATVRDAEPVLRPSAPDGRLVIGVCLALGAGMAILVVVMAELLDRSYRSPRGLAASLGLPVIASIDEILTAERRRRRLLRGTVLAPATLLVLCGLLFYSGAMAYLNLERPRGYDVLRQSPLRIYEVCWGEMSEE